MNAPVISDSNTIPGLSSASGSSVSDSDSAAYIQLQKSDGEKLVWGCGVDSSIEMAGLKALVSAWNLAR